MLSFCYIPDYVNPDIDFRINESVSGSFYMWRFLANAGQISFSPFTRTIKSGYQHPYLLIIMLLQQNVYKEALRQPKGCKNIQD